MRRRNSHLVMSAATLLAVGFIASSARAASATWLATPTDANWATASNWNPAAAPGDLLGTNTNPDTATFNATMSNGFGTTSPVVIDAGRNLNSMTFSTAAASAYVIGTTGGNALLLSSGGTIQTDSDVVNVQTVNAPLELEPATSTTAGTYTFSSNAASATHVLNLGGAISAGATTSTQTLTLTGTNTYTGATLISGGTLSLDATGTINNTSEVSLATVGTFDVTAKGLSGYTVGTLKGSGNVTGTLTVSTQFAIGNSPGTTNFSSSLTLGAGSTFVYELTSGATPSLGSADLGDVAATLTITAGSILDLVQLGTYTVGNKFTLFAYDGLLTGTFQDTSANILSDGATFTDAGGIWMTDYNDTTAGANGGVSASNTYVTITAIPEPNVAALLGGRGALALLRRRR